MLPPLVWRLNKAFNIGQMRLRKFVFPVLIFVASFLSLAFLRMDAVAGKSWEGLVGSGIWFGLLLDSVVALIALAFLYWGLAIRLRVGAWVFTLLLFTVFILTLTDNLYFKFFGAPLRLWVLQNHLFDLSMISGSATSLGFRPGILFAFFSLFVAVFASMRYGLVQRTLPHRRLRALLTGFALVLFAVYLHQLQHKPVLRDYFNFPSKEFRLPGNLAASGAVFSLLRELDPKYRDNFGVRLTGGVPEAQTILNEYRGPVGAAPSTEATRRALGLDPKRVPNVIVMFIESLRGYEFLNPELGPKLFPATYRALREHGLLFSQTYSSSLTAGQSVRGMFSSLCSALPNMLGPAPLLAYPDQEIDCVHKKLAEAGYQTFWMVPHSQKFHNIGHFERLQKTSVITDSDTFGNIPGADYLEIGLADDFFYAKVLSELERQRDPQKPFFLHAINVGTHHPWGRLPPSAPPELSELGGDQYALYSSRLRYWDYSFGRFLKELYAKPWMRDTVLVMVSDHAVRDSPPPGLGVAQNEEKNYRVGLALFGLNLKPGVSNRLSHQMDVAPTVAALAGVELPQHFLGHNLLDSSRGTPWVFIDDKKQVNYRVADRSCFSLPESQGRACYQNTPAADLLFEKNPRTLEEISAERSFFERVSAAEHLLHGQGAWKQ